jgi:peptidoglycan/LPS O-acetylase OafA/YrhL
MYFRWAFCLIVGSLIPWFKETSGAWLNAVSKNIAKYSYGIHLSHMPVMNLVFGGMRPAPGFLKWLTLAVLVSFVPVALYELIEHPMIRIGHRIAERFHPPAGVEWTGKGSLDEGAARASSAAARL